ncbi:MAG: hypothetical protein ACE5GF_06825 [Thermodesulfobacteriota bacterium]
MSGKIRRVTTLAAIAVLICGVMHASAQRGSEESLSAIRPLPRTTIPAIKWGRDPFQPLVSHPVDIGLKLSAVIYNREKPSAIIGNEVLYVGDRIDDFKIIAIGENYVILRGVGGRVRLDIKR